MVQDSRIWFGESGNNVPSIKRFLSEVKDGITPLTIWTYDEVGHNQTAKTELKKLFEGRDSSIFDTPKPISLMKRLLEIGSNNDSIVLDFFAGSASFAHGVFVQNVKDKGTRKCISIQLPERVNHENGTISDLAKERIRLAAVKIKEENPDYDGDLGFKSLKLDSSNIKPWDADFEDIEGSLLGAVDNIKSERSEEDVLYEILLKYGLDLTLPIKTRMIEGKKVFSIGFGALVICLDSNITLDVVEGIGKLKAELEPEVMRVVFKDNGFKDDVVKTNAIQILKRYDIEDVKSL
jgi:adenine-specific DNA-methyltransferase